MEIWKDISEYEGLYQVSNLGRVRSLERIIVNKNGEYQRYNEMLLKFDVMLSSNTKYHRVTLCKNHKTKRFFVHRLVALMFIPNPSSKEYVNHIDNDGINNSIFNLEWCTHSENMLHAQKQGRLFETQSRAGLVAGKLARVRTASKAAAIYLQKFNHWTAISPEVYIRARKNYVLCSCVCGKTQQIEISRLLRKVVTSCRRCAKNPKVQDIV